MAATPSHQLWRSTRVRIPRQAHRSHTGSARAGETMVLRVLRVGAGLLLVTSGALMYAASWQRWAGVCPWGDDDGARCSVRQDHRYDFVAPSAPWEPVGEAAQLAGWSLLVLALAFALLPWALTGRRPRVASAVALVGAVLALGDSGRRHPPLRIRRQRRPAGRAVDPALFVWLSLPPVRARPVRGRRPRLGAGRGRLAGPGHSAHGRLLVRGGALRRTTVVGGRLRPVHRHRGPCLLGKAVRQRRSATSGSAEPGVPPAPEGSAVSLRLRRCGTRTPQGGRRSRRRTTHPRLARRATQTA